jgi:glycosyltransferase involved in cell wall biosynthesis
VLPAGHVLKIAYFVNHYPKVSHSFIRREILALERQGFEVQRIAIHGWADPLPDLQDQRERARTQYVLRSGAVRLLLPTLRVLFASPIRFFSALRLAFSLARDSDRSLPYHLGYIAEACQIIPWMKAFGAERVHAHFGNNSTEIALLAHALGGPPFSFSIHGPHEFGQPMGLREKIHRSSFVIAVCSFGRSQLYLRADHQDWPKIKVVRCGIEKAFYDVASPIFGNERRLVCVGRLCEEKGQLLLVEATARLAAKGIRFELVLAGDGPMRKELEESIEKNAIGKQVRITGWISSDAVRDELLAARALVLPSFAEGLPVVIMEALALRRPVLATYVAGIPELVVHGINGWLFPAGSIDELADAIEDCLSRPIEELREMGSAGHDRVLLRHSIDSEAGKLAELFRTGQLDVSAKGMLDDLAHDQAEMSTEA